MKVQEYVMAMNRFQLSKDSGMLKTISEMVDVNNFPPDTEFEPGDVIEVCGIAFVLIPPGVCYTKAKEVTGAKEIDDTYKITKPFWCQIYPLTWENYLTFCKETGRKEPEKPTFSVDSDHPVVNVSFYDAKAFTDWLSEKIKGLKLKVAGTLFENISKADLPSIYQQIYMSRGNKDKRSFPWGDTWDRNNCICGMGSTKSVYCDESVRGMSPFGVTHCAGMVFEWSRTRYPPDSCENDLDD